jgi:hypothetical protein
MDCWECEVAVRVCGRDKATYVLPGCFVLTTVDADVLEME